MPTTLSQSATLIFPHQLFSEHPAVAKGRTIYLIEEWLFFRQYKFHKQKLALHRASMKSYEESLRKQKHRVRYVASEDELSDVRKLIQSLAQAGVKEVHYVDVIDDWLEQRIGSSCAKFNITTNMYASPNFLLSYEEGQAILAGEKRHFLTRFYVEQRKRFRILLEPNGKPVGGQWSFDTDNRSRLPKGSVPPKIAFPKSSTHVEEARRYVERTFSKNYGTTDSLFGQSQAFYPVIARGANEWLNDFLSNRFVLFGKYEDAIASNEHVLFHSVLTPMLNIGLLNPAAIVENALEVGKKNKIPLNSVEGFLRQVIGWREFIRIVYEKDGRKQRTRNFWGFKRKIPKSFWRGTTGILPVDLVIKKVLATGYAHHIERLMVLGNFMLLCEFDPDDVYRWFMEMFVDAYDWVMVPNVYGMSQFADGGLMSTKPYISGSNYLMKMGDFPKGAWQETWDALFWRFMHVHRDFFLQNPRLGMLVRAFDKQPLVRRKQHLSAADRFLETL
jgi:deoxyribodipyrimidine photolyase-related protein